jgi:hypothetical protein
MQPRAREEELSGRPVASPPCAHFRHSIVCFGIAIGIEIRFDPDSDTDPDGFGLEAGFSEPWLGQ